MDPVLSKSPEGQAAEVKTPAQKKEGAAEKTQGVFTTHVPASELQRHQLTPVRLVHDAGAKKTQTAVNDTSTHLFLEKRISPTVLSKAGEVVDSWNKNIITKKPLDEAETKKLEKEFLETLPSYGTFTNQEFLLKEVLDKSLGVHQFAIRDFSGGSGAKTYGIFIPDNNGKLTYIVKTMEGLPGELAMELRSLQQLCDLHLRQSYVSTVYAAGTFKLEQSPAAHTVFIQTSSKGQEFTSLVKKAGAAQGTERHEKIAFLKEGLAAAARGLAELHLKNRSAAAPVSTEVQTYNKEYLKEVYDWTQENLSKEGGKRIPMTQAELEGLNAATLAAVEGNWGIAGYSHGDTHLDNLFVTPSSTEVPVEFSLIDTPSFLASCDKQGHPVGFPAYDYAWTWGSIAEKGFLSGLTVEEVSGLQDAFAKEYMQTMGTEMPPKQALNLALLTKQLFFISKANGYQEYVLDLEAGKLPDKKKKDDPAGEIERAQRLINHMVAHIARPSTL